MSVQKTEILNLTINMLDIECHRPRFGLFYSRCLMNIYRKFRSHHIGNNLSKTPAFFFVFLSLLIATYFLSKLIMKGIKSNPSRSYGGLYGIEKAVQGTFHQGSPQFGELYNALAIHIDIIFSAIKKVSLWKTIERERKLRTIWGNCSYTMD